MDYRQVLQAGTVLDGKYRIERVIGSGGFGITYEAFDIGLAAPVAIKEYYPSQFGVRDATMSVRPRSDRDRELFDRLLASFLREARTLNQFDHTAIVRVLSVFEAHGTAYMVMKYETGPSLKAWLAGLGRTPTQDQLDRLLIPLLDALEMMHNAEFLHRDIAPDNIIVRADGSPVLLDFGASRRVMGEMTGTLTGVVKKGFSPQEQYATDSRSQGPWTDIYALGATLYRCVTGETPYEATERMLEDNVMPATKLGVGRYRPSFLAAIDAAMVLRPRERPQSIATWRPMLLEGLVASSQPQSWPQVAYDTQVPSIGEGPTRWTNPQSRPRHSAPGAQRSHPSYPSGGPASYPSHPGSQPAGYQPSQPGYAAPPYAPPQASQPYGGGGAPSADQPASRNWSATAMVAGVALLVGGGATLFALNRNSEPRNVTPSIVAPKQPASNGVDESARALERLQREAAEAQRAAERAQTQQNELLARLAREREQAAAIERQRAEAEKQKRDEEARQRAQAELQRLAEEAQRREDEERRRLAEEARNRAEAERLRQADEARRRQADEDRRRAEAEKFRIEEEARKRAESERLRVAEENRRAEIERQRLADEARRRADADRQRIALLEQRQADQQREQQRLARLAARPRQIAFAPAGSTDGRSAIYPAAVAATDTIIAAGGSNGTVRLWNAADGQARELRGTGHQDVVSAIAFAPGGETIATASWDGEIRLWPVQGTSQRYRTADRVRVVSLRFLTAQRFVAVLANGQVQTWNVGSAAPVSTIRLTGLDRLTSAALSPDGATIATGNETGTVSLWSLVNGRKIRDLTGHGDWVLALAFSSNSGRLATASADGTARLWDLSSGRQLREFRGPDTAIRSVAITQAGDRIVAGADNGVVTLWDANTGGRIATLSDHRNSVRALSISDDGNRIVSAGEDGDLRAIYLDTLQQAANPTTTR